MANAKTFLFKHGGAATKYRYLSDQRKIYLSKFAIELHIVSF